MRVNLTWADGQTRDYDMGKKIHQWYEKKKNSVDEKYPILNYN